MDRYFGLSMLGLYIIIFILLSRVLDLDIQFISDIFSLHVV